jgi:predicted RNA-binding protein YlxR (DUF448 family)
VSVGRHVPIRTCMGCGQRDLQPALVRVQAAADGTLRVVSPHGVHAGRSGYLHDRRACWEQFAGRKGRVRSLGQSLDRAQRAGWLRALEQTVSAAKTR